MPACGYLCQFVGWESVFYVFGSLGVVWFIAWSLLVFDGPDVHPRISYDEREYLQVEDLMQDYVSVKCFSVISE